MVGGTPKIIDFEHASHATEENTTTWGTTAYMSPEKFKKVAGFDGQAADMYAFGVTLHLAALSCFPNGTVDALPILESDWDSTGVAAASLHPDVAEILGGLLKADPTERWTAQMVVDKLNGATEAVSRLAHSISVPDMASLSNAEHMRLPNFEDVLRANISVRKTNLSAVSSSSPLPSPLVTGHRNLLGSQSPMASPNLPCPQNAAYSPHLSPHLSPVASPHLSPVLSPALTGESPVRDPVCLGMPDRRTKIA